MAQSHHLSPVIQEAKRYLGPATESQESAAFVRRQIGARERLGALDAFYEVNRCRMSQIHLLTASCVAIARFCGISDAFNAMGAAIMPINSKGEPATGAWQAYCDACAAGRPLDHRDALWLEAHAEDWRNLLEMGLDVAFQKDAEANLHNRHWQLMRRHTEITVDTRQLYPLAAEGLVASETAMSGLLGKAMVRAVQKGWPLFFRYAKEVTRALLFSGKDTLPSPSTAPGYRETAVILIRSFLLSTSGWKIYRRGIRHRNRGIRCEETDWPVLETVMSHRVEQVDPLIVKFYRNPGRFDATASLRLETLPLKIYSRLATLLAGQGLYENDLPEIPAQLRVFRRDDGSMHFVRELYCGDALRVFDSDFVIEDFKGSPHLVEVFRDIGVKVILHAENRPNGGVAVVSKAIYWRRIKLPDTPLKIEFSSERKPGQSIRVRGALTFAPRNRFENFVIHKWLKRPTRLGEITYDLKLKSDSQERCRHDADSLSKSL